MTRAALEGAVAAGVLRPIAVEPMAHLFVAALSEAAFVIAYADSRERPGPRWRQALIQLVEGLRV